MDTAELEPGDRLGAAPETLTLLRTALADAIADVVERDLFFQRVVELVAGVAQRPQVALYIRSAAGSLQLRASTRNDAAPAPARIVLESDDVVEIMATPEHSALVAPLAFNDAPFGAIVVFSEAGARFSAQDRARMRAIVDEIAPTVAVAEQHHALKQATIVDQLTGAHTSGYLAQRLDEELARAQRGAGVVTVLLVGIPGFEEWRGNVTYAQLEARLREMAGALAAATRIFDIVAYQGDGTFAVVLPDTDRDGASAVVDRVRAQLRRHHQRTSAEQTEQTAASSIVTGLATFPQDDGRGTALLLAAEHRLDEDRHQQRRATGA